MKKYLHKSKWFFLALAFISCNQQEPAPDLQFDKAPQSVEIFGEGFISTDLYERDFALSPDGNELIYSLGDYKQSIRALVHVIKSNNGWSQKQILPFSGKYHDIEPFYAPDGTKLFFASTRPVDPGSEAKDYNIWVSEKTDGVWEEPSPLDTIINSSQDEYYPSVTKNGNLYFTASRPDGYGREDIFVSTLINGVYQQPIALDSNINTVSFEFNAYVHPDESYIIFGSFGRPDGLGGGDLYVSTKDDAGHWTPAQHMGESINSDKLDYCPFVDVKTNSFFFTSERSEIHEGQISSVPQMINYSNRTLNGMGNIFWVNADLLTLD